MDKSEGQESREEIDHVAERPITTQSSTLCRYINEVSGIIIFNLSHVAEHALCLSPVPCQLGDRIFLLLPTRNFSGYAKT
jgi:hypothetical protein